MSDYDEPDEPKPSREPVCFVVEWFEPMNWTEQWAVYDPHTDTYHTETVPMSDRARTFRQFAADAHGSTNLAYRAARRWLEAMQRRYGTGHAFLESTEE